MAVAPVQKLSDEQGLNLTIEPVKVKVIQRKLTRQKEKARRKVKKGKGSSSVTIPRENLGRYGKMAGEGKVPKPKYDQMPAELLDEEQFWSDKKEEREPAGKEKVGKGLQEGEETEQDFGRKRHERMLGGELGEQPVQAGGVLDEEKGVGERGGPEQPDRLSSKDEQNAARELKGDRRGAGGKSAGEEPQTEESDIVGSPEEQNEKASKFAQLKNKIRQAKSIMSGEGAAAEAVKQGSKRLLQLAWTHIIPTGGTSLFYLQLHFIGRYWLKIKSLPPFGEEWTPSLGGAVKFGGAAFLETLEFVALLVLSLIYDLFWLIVLVIITIIIFVLVSPLEFAQQIGLGTLWELVRGAL